MDLQTQSIAKQFFDTRTEKDFTKYYNTLFPLSLRVAATIFPKDKDKQHEIANSVFIKMWKSETFIFDNTKSHKSYIYLTTLNFAKIEYNKCKRKTVKVKVEKPKEMVELETKLRQNGNYKDRKNDEKLLIRMKKAEFNKKIDKQHNCVDDNGNKMLVLKPQRAIADKLKPNRVVHFSDLINESDTEKEFSLLEHYLFANNPELVNDSKFDEIETNSLLAPDEDDPNTKYRIIVQAIHEICEEKQKTDETMDPLLIIEALSRSDQYDTLIKKFGLKTVGAVKSRVFRIKDKLNDRIKEISNSAKYADGNKKLTGKIRNVFEDSKKTKSLADLTDGKINGEFKRFYESGGCRSISFYKNGIRDGEFKKFYEDGNILMSGTYRNGKKDGIWRTYHENGNLNTFEEYCDMELSYFALYNGKGNEDKHIEFNEICKS